MFRNSLDGQVPGSGRPPIPRHVGGFIPGQPTFEDLSIDDTLSEIERIVKYARSSIGLQRYVEMRLSFPLLDPFLPPSPKPIPHDNEKVGAREDAFARGRVCRVCRHHDIDNATSGRFVF